MWVIEGLLFTMTLCVIDGCETTPKMSPIPLNVKMGPQSWEGITL